MNNNGSSIIEFVIAFGALSTILIYIFFSLNTFIDKINIQTSIFLAMREVSLNSNKNKTKAITLSDIKNSLRKYINPKGPLLEIDLIESTEKKIKLNVFYHNKNLINYFYNKEFVFYR